uniref:Amino acid transporter transmembrane domain-containing protein n=1 Tax=Chrysotila carterae TaxID=13221 RepID=A0A7S4BSW3_CHRCT
MLAALNTHLLLQHAAPSLTIEACALLVAAIVWLHVFLKTLGEVAVVSYFNMCVNVSLLVIVIASSLSHPPTTPPHTTFVVTDAMSFGSAFASFGFAFGVHPVLPSIRSSMRRPAQYSSMVLCSFAGTLLFYLPITIVCYAVYGDEVQSPITDTEALEGSAAVKVVTAAITGHLIMSYPLLVLTPETALEETLRVDDRACPLAGRIMVRSLFIGFTTLVTIALRTPARFAPLLDLVSACTSTFTVFILPCVFYLKLRRMISDASLLRREVCWNALIVTLAATGAAFGTVDALNELVRSYAR